MAKKSVITIRPYYNHPETHSLVQVHMPSGVIYQCVWAGTPDETDVRDAWREDRKGFELYHG